VSEAALRYDAIVIGAGIVGAAVVARLARAGMRVAVVERDVVGGGATAASMGHLVVLDDDPAELALSAWSCARWRELAAELPEGVDYSACGTLWLARNAQEMEEAQHKQKRLAAAGVAADVIGDKALYACEPGLGRGMAGALHVPGDALVYPPLAALHLLRQAQAAGADLFSDSDVRDLDGDTVVLGDGREFRADAVIVATGNAVPTVMPQVPLRPRKGHLLITTRAAPRIRHALIELGYVSSAHGDAPESVAFNAQPRPTGQILLGSSRQFDVTDSVVEPRIIQALCSRAMPFLPWFGELTVLRCWTGFRPTTPDHRPLIGRWPGTRHWLAAGHEGLGVTTSLGTAEVIAAQLLGSAMPFDATPFDPARLISAPLMEAAHAA
jgi:glycine/D-amino acid oxidase-like deaminating enzyme